MKKILIILTAIVGCSSPKKIENSSLASPSKIRELQITFLVDRKDLSYRFKFYNKSTEKISIVMPKLYGINSIFKLYDSNLTVLNRKCASIKYSNDVEFIELGPSNETIAEGDLPLSKYFCRIDETDLLSFFYNGIYEVKNQTKNEGGRFSFEIEPIKIHDLDSVVIRKKLF